MSSGRQAVRRQTFFVGGSYAGPSEARVMQGQMFVEALTPERVLHPYPLVLMHGGAQTASCWLTTPDGREGWAEMFAERGWIVYLVDQPARGRSAWQPGLAGPLTTIPVPYIERLFTACADYDAGVRAASSATGPRGPAVGLAAEGLAPAADAAAACPGLGGHGRGVLSRGL